ncbi:MAG: hypothetical protein GYA56_12295 [Geobacteraceae bacterium]|nr:hypothetical protein [Geobacteraceae bacterium]
MSTKLFDITKQLKEFVSSSSSSGLLKETNGISGISIIEAHIQKRRLETDGSGMIRMMESTGSDCNCINIVNVAVAEKNRRKGLFSDFLELLETFDYGPCADPGSDFHVRVDKVMNPILDEYLPKKGYSRIRSGSETHYSYLKAVRRGKDLGSGFSPEIAGSLEGAVTHLPIHQEVMQTAR